jgi:regulator of protease activity HflC (stomatin/prohibitin superfamily)
MRMTSILLALSLVAALLLVALGRANLRRVTVFEFERGLRYVRGRFTGVVEPGLYWTWVMTTAIRKIDMRARMVPVAGQEVLSADGVAIKASLSATYRVVDPAQAVNAVESYESALYATLQLALRAIIASRPAEEVLQQRASLGPELLQQAGTAVQQFGLELLEADLKDLTLPGELKKIFAQVVRARQEGLAALEKARGETAALRSLANAANMIERNPHLMQVRLLQVLGERSGNTVVLGVPSSSAPIPVRGVEPTTTTLPEAAEGPEA